MARVHVSQPRADCLVIEEGRDWLRALPALLATLSLAAALWWVREAELSLVALAVLGLFLLPLWVQAARAMRTRTTTLVRSSGRLLLNGEPLDLARVELRVLAWPLVKKPRGYALSLWMHSLAGPSDLPLGTFATLVQASSRAGLCEEFVQRASANEPHRA